MPWKKASRSSSVPVNACAEKRAGGGSVTRRAAGGCGGRTRRGAPTAPSRPAPATHQVDELVLGLVNGCLKGGVLRLQLLGAGPPCRVQRHLRRTRRVNGCARTAGCAAPASPRTVAVMKVSSKALPPGSTARSGSSPRTTMRAMAAAEAEAARPPSPCRPGGGLPLPLPPSPPLLMAALSMVWARCAPQNRHSGRASERGQSAPPATTPRRGTRVLCAVTRHACTRACRGFVSHGRVWHARGAAKRGGVAGGCTGHRSSLRQIPHTHPRAHATPRHPSHIPLPSLPPCPCPSPVLRTQCSEPTCRPGCPCRTSSLSEAPGAQHHGQRHAQHREVGGRALCQPRSTAQPCPHHR